MQNDARKQRTIAYEEDLDGREVTVVLIAFEGQWIIASIVPMVDEEYTKKLLGFLKTEFKFKKFTVDELVAAGVFKVKKMVLKGVG